MITHQINPAMKKLEIHTPIGNLTIIAQNGFAMEIIHNQSCDANCVDDDYPVLVNAATQIKEYFSGERKTFDIPINPQGGEFHRRVWDKMVHEVGFGELITYGELAKKCGNPRAARAVGMANNRNPIPIIIPCHRVIGASGKLTGFRWGLGVKEKLLEIEGH